MARKPDVGTTRASEARNMRVLLVDHETDYARAVAAMLRGQGHDCDITETGEEAVRRARSAAYDLILLDIALPDLDGYEVMLRLRDANVRTPVLMQSGLVEKDCEALALSFGVDTCLIKPFDRGELSDGMDRALRMADTVVGGPKPMRDRRSPCSPADRRKHRRSKVIKASQIVYRNANCVMDCTIMNISEGGAALKPADPAHCPRDFVLKIMDGPEYRCETCWHFKDKIGVRFLDT